MRENSLLSWIWKTWVSKKMTQRQGAICMSPLWQWAICILGILTHILCVCYPRICSWSGMLWTRPCMLLQCCLTGKVNVYEHFNSNTLFWFDVILQLLCILFLKAKQHAEHGKSDTMTVLNTFYFDNSAWFHQLCSHLSLYTLWLCVIQFWALVHFCILCL